ncbi:MAG TPA: phospholipase A [Polyangiaceae bacterium]|nr:phospholipase A [Polyangiaceae bacterium]
MLAWTLLAATTSVEPVEPARVDEPELDVLTFHDSNYVLTGFTERTQVKFQFSFKYDLWPNTGHHTVYLAYTQKSLWDLYDRSSPFRESNYAPEVFYAHYHSEDHDQPSFGCGLFREQVGVWHESNGEAGAASRSWNRAFGDVEASCYGNVWYGLLGLRAWYPFGVGENPDITRMQGYGELRLGVGIDDDLTHLNALLTVALRKGTSRDLGKGSLTIDARLRPSYQRLLGKAWKFAPFIWFQYFGGYGETLGTYDQPTSSVRVGLGFTDRAR